MTKDEERPNGASLQDVAELAGVHKSTASRVLRRSEPPDGWSQNALRVLDAARQLDYRPNVMAASLRTKQSKTIGLVMPRLTDVVIATICESIEVTARYAGYQTLLTTPPDTINAQVSSMQFLLSRQVDGIIATSLHRDNWTFAQELLDLQVPLVASNRRVLGNVLSVVSADEEGGWIATDHLLRLGHRRIGIVAGPRHASTAFDRMLGYRRALSDAGLEVDESLIVHSDFEVEGGVLGAHALLSLADPPTAIFAVNDTAAIGVMGAVSQRGLRIPEDLSLVGYNDIRLVAQLPIPLTTIRADLERMGARATQLLIQAISGNPVASEVLPVSLVVRSSTRERGPTALT